MPEGDKLESFLFSPNGEYQLAMFVGPTLNRAMRVYQNPDMRECFAVETEGYGFTPSAFSTDGKLLIRPDPPQGDKPFSFVVVDSQTGTIRSTLNIELEKLSFGMFHSIALTPDRKWVYSNQDDRVLIWNVLPGKIVTYWVWRGTGAVIAIGSTADSRFVRTLMQEGSIANFDTSTAPPKITMSRLDVPAVDPKEPRMIPFNKSWSFGAAAFSQDGTHVLNDVGGKINVYDVKSGKLTRILTLPDLSTAADLRAMQGDLVPVYMQDNSIAIVRIPL